MASERKTQKWAQPKQDFIWCNCIIGRGDWNRESASLHIVLGLTQTQGRNGNPLRKQRNAITHPPPPLAPQPYWIKGDHLSVYQECKSMSNPLHKYCLPQLIWNSNQAGKREDLFHLLVLCHLLVSTFIMRSSRRWRECESQNLDNNQDKTPLHRHTDCMPRILPPQKGAVHWWNDGTL